MGLCEFRFGIFLTAMAVGGLLGSVVCEQLQKILGTHNALALDFAGTLLFFLRTVHPRMLENLEQAS